MNTAEFETSARGDGYEIVPRDMSAGFANADHKHPFDARGLVTAGEMTITVDAVATLYRAGDIFTMPAGRVHREAAGPEGVKYLAGRRHVS